MATLRSPGESPAVSSQAICSGRNLKDQRLPEWVHRRDADPRRKGGHLLLYPTAGK